MKISAIICEYNPFHAGHLYHIRQTKRLTGCDHVVAIMSGSVVQRGLPAIYDKWARTDAALSCGADLVLELPAGYACASAERFAYGAVRLAELTGIADTLSFGCETEDLSLLQSLAELFSDEPEAYQSYLRRFLADGNSFARSRAIAAEKLIPGAERILSESNAILAVEYLKALKRLNSDILPCPILRAGSSAEQSDSLPDQYASARAIRKALADHTDLPAGTIPSEAEKFFRNNSPVFIGQFSDLLLYRLRSMSPAELAQIAEVSEGIEHKILLAARSSSDYAELLGNIKSKRYPQSRLQRILMNTLLGITKEMQMQMDAAPYIRVLGVKKESTHLLSLLSAHAKAPVITSPAGIDNIGLSLDIRATDIRAIMDADKTAGRDYTEKLHIL